jgi:hypothetical protein
MPIRVAGIVLVVVLVNVLPRFVGIDFPSISLPDLPAWADTAGDVIHAVVKVKNWAVAGVVAVVLVGVVIEGRSRSRAP